MIGSCDRASQPIAEETTGTVAPAEHDLPLLGDERLDRPLADQCAVRPSWARKANATPYSPGGGRIDLEPLGLGPRKKASGIWSKIPAPSPVSWSQPQAPRC